MHGYSGSELSLCLDSGSNIPPPPTGVGLKVDSSYKNLNASYLIRFCNYSWVFATLIFYFNKSTFDNIYGYNNSYKNHFQIKSGIFIRKMDLNLYELVQYLNLLEIHILKPIHLVSLLRKEAFQKNECYFWKGFPSK